MCRNIASSRGWQIVLLVTHNFFYFPIQTFLTLHNAEILECSASMTMASDFQTPAHQIIIK